MFLKQWLESTNGCIRLNTASDGAAKNYDSLITQYCGMYQDESTGGMDDALKRMIEYDSEFVLGLAFELQLRHMGFLYSTRTDHSLSMLYDNFEKLVKRKSDSMTEHESLHADVVKLWSTGKIHEATQVLERIVTLYPEDVAALKMCQDLYFALGPTPRMRNSLAYSTSVISDKNPLKGYVHGLYSFALEESHMYEQSQQEALKALNLIPNDTWAIHNYAHCLEMQGNYEEGLKWMDDKKCDWSPCQILASHQHWHTALFMINSYNFDDAIDLLDTEILPRSEQDFTSLDLHNSISMIYRMELVDLFNRRGKNSDEKNRWQRLYEHCKPHRRDHLLGFNDAHFMMSFLGAGDLDLAREFINSIDESSELIEGQTVVKPLLEAMYQFKKGSYDQAVDLLAPIRFEISKIGGSHAQRDVFEQLLLVAALKSEKPANRKLGERMIIERESFHGRKLPQTDLLAAQKSY